jgi:hypothetical protein
LNLAEAAAATDQTTAGVLGPVMLPTTVTPAVYESIRAPEVSDNDKYGSAVLPVGADTSEAVTEAESLVVPNQPNEIVAEVAVAVSAVV